MMRLDADEVVTPELAAALHNGLPGYPATVMGLTVNRQIHFLVSGYVMVVSTRFVCSACGVPDMGAARIVGWTSI